jgi:hypothetical protein
VALNHLVDFPGLKTHHHGTETSNYETTLNIFESSLSFRTGLYARVSAV